MGLINVPAGVMGRTIGQTGNFNGVRPVQGSIFATGNGLSVRPLGMGPPNVQSITTGLAAITSPAGFPVGVQGVSQKLVINPMSIPSHYNQAHTMTLLPLYTADLKEAPPVHQAETVPALPQYVQHPHLNEISHEVSSLDYKSPDHEKHPDHGYNYEPPLVQYSLPTPNYTFRRKVFSPPRIRFVVNPEEREEYQNLRAKYEPEENEEVPMKHAEAHSNTPSLSARSMEREVISPDVKYSQSNYASISRRRAARIQIGILF